MSTEHNRPTRIVSFVDYWNVQLTLNEKESERQHVTDVRSKIDWRNLGKLLAQRAAEKVGVEDNYSFDGVIIYGSFNPQTAEGKKYKQWMTTWLNRQPGIQVQCLERQPRACPKCPTCHKPIEICPHEGCKAPIKGSIEKGVDTLIVTDMIRLAWEQAFDIAVVASSDRDLVPAVNFLGSKGIKVVQAGFPPLGVHLATSCWASFDIYRMRSEILRP